MAASSIKESCPSPSVRVIVQQCLSARLQVQPPSDNKEAEWVEISRGIVIYLCFLKDANLELIPKVVKSILNVRLSEVSSDRGTNVSVLELPGDVLIVPQATLGGKLKGKAVQYHSNISKEEGKRLYDSFISLCEEKLTGGSTSLSDNTRVKHVLIAAMSGVADWRKLVLHLDVNNTVLIGDSITKQRTLSEALNEYLVDVVWGWLDENGDWKMDSETLSEKPPKAGLYSYYRFAENKYIGKSREKFKSHIRKFTEENSGKPFRCYYDEMLTALRFPGEFRKKSANLPTSNSGELLYHRIVPSFYKLVHNLLAAERDFALAFRTFGEDGHLPLQATKEFLGTYKEVPMKACRVDTVDMSPGIITRSSYDQICLKLAENDTLTSFNDVYTYFSQLHGVKLFVDDYSWWKSQGFNSKAGKPLLIDLSDPKVHHIMFDDNFRSWELTDSIVDVRLAKEGSFSSTDAGMFEDTCVVRADLFQSICNPNYFIDKIELCEQNYGKMLLESPT